MGISLLYVLLLWVPWQPKTISGIDGSWAMALHFAFMRSLDFGSQIVFTYGPWGFVYAGFHPRTVWWGVIFWGFLGVAFWAGAWSTFRQSSGSSLIAALWTIALTTATVLSFDLLIDVRLMIIFPLLFLEYFYCDDRKISWVKVVLIVACGWAGLTKFPMLLLGGVTVLAISVDEIFREKRKPWTLIVYVATLTFFWMVAGQSPLTIFAFIKSRIGLTSGYEAAMANEMASPFSIGFFLFASIVAGALVSIDAVFRLRYWASLPLTPLAICWFVAFKTGYVRHDGHELVATGYLLASAIVYVAATNGAATPSARWHSANRFLAGATLASALGLAWLSMMDHAHESLPSAALSAVARTPGTVGDATRRIFGLSRDQFRYQAYLDSFRQTIALPKIDETVDSYPHDTLAILANDLAWDPRPVFHSYSAYTRNTLRMNADHLRSANAPKFVLFDFWPIDNRFPALDDSLSILELLARYEPVDASMSHLLLKRIADAKAVQFEAIADIDAKLNEEVSFPNGAVSPIWATVDTHLSAKGVIGGLLYKPPVLGIEVILANGTARRFRLVPEIAREGFLLSPLIENRMQMAMLASRQWNEELGGQMVTKLNVFAITESGTSVFYKPEIHVRISKLNYDRRDVSSVPGIPEHLRLSHLSSQIKVLQAAMSPALIVRPMGGTVFALKTPTSLAVPLSAQSSTIHVAFGLLESSELPKVEATTEPVVFRVSVATDTGELVPIGSRTLDPKNKEDRGLQQADMPQPVRGTTLVLQATNVEGHGSNMAFWSDVNPR